MSSNSKVSVIIPSYNYARFLPDCIESLKKQTYQNWEAVIVDDGSTDDTPRVAQALVAANSGVVHYHRVENGGVARARNIACENSSGEFLLPLDADDMLLPNALEVLLEALCSDGRYGYAYSALQNYGCLPGESRAWLPGPFFRRWILNENNAACTGMFRRQLFESGVRYEELIHEDWDLWLQIVSRGLEGVYVPEPLLMYRSHPDGRHSTNRHLYMLAFFEEVRRHPNLYHGRLQEAAELALKNVPEALRYPSIAFLICNAQHPFLQSEGPLFQFALDLIQNGFFVAAIGEWSTAPQIPGLAALNTPPGQEFEQRAERLGMLGSKLIVIHDKTEHESLLLKASENVVSSVSVAPEYDEEAAMNLGEGNGSLNIVRSIADSSPIRTDDLISTFVTMANGEGNRYLSVQNAARSIVKKLDDDAVEQGKEVSIGVVVFSEGQLSGVFEQQKNLFSQSSIPFSIAPLRYPTDVDSFHSEAELVQCPDDRCWSRSVLANSALSHTKTLQGSDWLCFVESDVLLSSKMLNQMRRYVVEVPSLALIPFEVQRLFPAEALTGGATGHRSGRKEVSFPADIECGGFFVRRAWLEEAGGFIEPLRSLDSLKEDLEFRAKLTAHSVCWLSEVALKGWSVPAVAPEWKLYDSAVLKEWRGSFLCENGIPQGGSVQKEGMIPVPVPDMKALTAHRAFCAQKTTAICSRASSGTPALLQALFDLGIELMQRQQPSAARIVFEDALALKFDFVEGWLGLGHACAHSGAIQLAGHCAAKAHALRPEDEAVKQLMAGIEEAVNG